MLLGSDAHAKQEAQLKELGANDILDTTMDKRTWKELKARLSERNAVSKLFALYVQ